MTSSMVATISGATAETPVSMSASLSAMSASTPTASQASSRRWGPPVAWSDGDLGMPLLGWCLAVLAIGVGAA